MATNFDIWSTWQVIQSVTNYKKNTGSSEMLPRTVSMQVSSSTPWGAQQVTPIRFWQSVTNILKAWAEQLGCVYIDNSNQSLRVAEVPHALKESIITPLSSFPKTNRLIHPAMTGREGLCWPRHCWPSTFKQTVTVRMSPHTGTLCP